MDFNIRANCEQCSQGTFMSAQGFLDNSDTINLKCPNGHETTAFNAAPRYALYFDKGISSFIDENYYEAFGWIYTSLEIFRKEFVKTVLNINHDIKPSILDNTYDKVFKSSERIYGAYSAAFLMIFGKNPEDKTFPYPLPQEVASHRNKLFHAGELQEVESIKIDCYKIYSHMRYVYGKFSKSGISHMQMYTSEGYSQWCADNHFTDEDVMSRKVTIYNHSLSSFQPNVGIDVDSTDGLPSFEELIEKELSLRLHKHLFNQ
ncbi:hypothetical protein DOK76_07415 [Vagococcus sp. DIV0080]|uniref:Apea-like HEPN domain-containing protein n=1 Tax=Candidatus Vagococcus giribetii TaxID=2230876 RepID=A0ABS3HT11_9ENTE|nr:hypothetical protein [Vagococcus sp. DIV0080]MBO0476894.1 hypothetical protein [Vagococcus sp. DIV0080]